MFNWFLKFYNGPLLVSGNKIIQKSKNNRSWKQKTWNIQSPVHITDLNENKDITCSVSRILHIIKLKFNPKNLSWIKVDKMMTFKAKKYDIKVHSSKNWINSKVVLLRLANVTISCSKGIWFLVVDECTSK